MKARKTILILFLAITTASGCFETDQEKQANSAIKSAHLFALSMYYYMTVNYCPAPSFTVKKGIPFPLALKKGETVWFRFSHEGNEYTTLSESGRNFPVKIGKDASATLVFYRQDFCRDIDSKPYALKPGTTSTSTELLYNLSVNDFNPDSSRVFGIESVDNQTNITIYQE